MSFFFHDQQEYYYADFGQGDPVVLLHGLGNTGRAWLQQVPALLAAGYRVIVPDLAGHGTSAGLQAPFSPAMQAKAIIRLLEHLGLDCADIVGLSLGGMVALELTIAAPEVVNRLVVAGTFYRLDTPNDRDMLDDWCQALTQPHGCLKRFEATWPLLVGEHFMETAQGLAAYQAWHAQAAKDNHSNHLHWCAGLRGYNVEAELASIRRPSLVIYADQDRISPRRISRQIAAMIPNSECVGIANDGHVFNVSASDEFNRTLVGFLGTTHAAGSPLNSFSV